MNRKFVLLLALLLCCTLVLTSCNNPLTSLWNIFNKEEPVEDSQEQVQEEIQSMSEITYSQPENSRATVLYYKDDENFLVPVMRYIPKEDLGIAKTALSTIIYSPEKARDLNAAGLTPTLPMGTEILGAVIKDDGLAIVDFSKEFLNFSSNKFK